MIRSPMAGTPLAPLLFLLFSGAVSLVALPWSTGDRPAQAFGDEAATFHASVEVPADIEGAAYCAECHMLPPHEGEGVAPAFFNDHTSFVECLVCHWARRSGAFPEPAWRKRPDGFMTLGLAPPGEAPADAGVLRAALLTQQPCFDRGLACATCHRPGGMEPYLRPGLSPEAQGALENLPDFFTLSSGSRWYFPQRQ